jgi:hypothetical protein
VQRVLYLLKKRHNKPDPPQAAGITRLKTLDQTVAFLVSLGWLTPE